MADSLIRDDVLVTGPLLPYTGGNNANIQNGGIGFTDLDEDGDFFCLGGFDWRQGQNKPDQVQMNGLLNQPQNDPGFSLFLGPSNFLSGNKHIRIDDTNGNVIISSVQGGSSDGTSNAVILTRNWPYGNANASTNVNNTQYTKLYFKWVHPSYINNDTVDFSSTSNGKKFKYFVAQTAEAQAGALIAPPLGTVGMARALLFGGGCQGTTYSSSSDLIDTDCSGVSILGIGQTTTSTIARHAKDGFLLKAYYASATNGKLVPATVKTYTINTQTADPDGKNKGATTITATTVDLYLHYHRTYSTGPDSPEYQSSGYLELLPINTKVDPYSVASQQWTVDGGFFFDKSKFQFDWNDGMDSLPSWNIYVDPTRIIMGWMPKDYTKSTLDPFSVSADNSLVSITLNFVAMPITWYSSYNGTYTNGYSFENTTTTIERQQCYRFYHAYPTSTTWASKCSAYGLTEDPTYEKYRGVTQSNIADLTKLKTFYVSNRGCGGQQVNTAYSTISPFNNVTNKYTYYNSFSGYCSYIEGQPNFQNTTTFPQQGCGYDGDCSKCSPDSCGQSICTSIINNKSCQNELCSTAARLCQNNQGDPNWNNGTSLSLIFIILLILAIFGLVLYYIYDKNKNSSSKKSPSKEKKTKESTMN